MAGTRRILGSLSSSAASCGVLVAVVFIAAASQAGAVPDVACSSTGGSDGGGGYDAWRHESCLVGHGCILYNSHERWDGPGRKTEDKSGICSSLLKTSG